MKTLVLCAVLFLFFACNDAKKEAQKDSLQLQEQQKQIDSLKASVNSIARKAMLDSIRKSKFAFWRKQSTLMTVNLYADKAMLNHAKQHRRRVSPARRKRDIKVATIQLEQDRKRAWQIHDSLKKYEE